MCSQGGSSRASDRPIHSQGGGPELEFQCVVFLRVIACESVLDPFIPWRSELEFQCVTSVGHRVRVMDPFIPWGSELEFN